MTAEATQLRKRYGAGYRWRVLLAVMVGMMAAIVSATIVNVAVPDISQAFEIGQDRAQWVATGFMVPMTLAMSLTPSLLQRFGLRKTYVGAVSALLGGGLIGGFSPNFDLMIGSRVIQGVAAGVLQPIPVIVILRAFAAGEHGRVTGLFGFGVVLAPALSPTLGGVLVQAFGWRAIFFFVVPFCLFALELARRYLPWKSEFIDPDREFDWTGLVLLSMATLLMLNGLVGLQGESVLLSLVMLAAAAPCIGMFAWWQWRQDEPLLRLKLLRYRQFSMGAIVAFGFGMGLFGSTYLLPVFLQIAMGYSPTAAGVALLPAGLVLAATTPLVGRLVDRIPANRLVTAGTLVLALSLASMARVSTSTTYLAIVILIVVGRIGLGMIMPALTVGAVRGLPPSDLPQAASMASYFRQLGGAFGVGLVGTLLEWRLHAQGRDPLVAFGETFLVLAAVLASSAVAAWRMRPTP